MLGHHGGGWRAGASGAVGQGSPQGVQGIKTICLAANGDCKLAYGWAAEIQLA